MAKTFFFVVLLDREWNGWNPVRLIYRCLCLCRGGSSSLFVPVTIDTGTESEEKSTVLQLPLEQGLRGSLQLGTPGLVTVGGGFSSLPVVPLEQKVKKHHTYQKQQGYVDFTHDDEV